MMQQSAPDPISYAGLPAVSQACGVSMRQLSRDIASGKLPSFLLGRKRLVLRADLEAYVRGRGQPPPSTANRSFARERKPPTRTRRLDGPLERAALRAPDSSARASADASTRCCA